MEEKHLDRIKFLLTKSLLSQLEEHEATELDAWRNASAENEELYNRLRDKEYINKRYSEYKSIKIRQVEQKQLTPQKSFFRILLQKRYAAAILIGVLTIFSVYQIIREVKMQRSLDNPMTRDAIVLVVDGKKSINLSAIANNVQIENSCIKIDSNTLKYFPKSGKSNHQILVPEIKQFKIILPDGSQVWVNSKSSISFSTESPSKLREVSLNGEGYFDIVRDIAKPFRVNVEGMNVNVTGTQFNIKAYSEDANVEATLVEGKIAIDYKNEAGKDKYYDMKKGEHSVLNKQQGSIDVRDVNTAIYTSWKDGIYFFDEQKLEDIMLDMERWYGIKVIFEDESAKQRVLSGKLKRENTPEELINSFAGLMPGHIKIDERTVTIY